MESVECKSPMQHAIRRETRSPPTHKTPVRQNDKKNRHTTFQSSLGNFTVLPTHITPPSGLTKFIARNPFDADLTSRLHLSVISPTVFSKVSPTVSREPPIFSWSVDELALMQPAKIEEFPTQMHYSDPDLETVAQAAIDKFFNENQIIPSPWDKQTKKPVIPNSNSGMTTPSRPVEDLNVTRETNKTKKDCWTQTVLTLPPQLPSHVEEALKPYFTFNQDQNVETDDANSSNSSLRRKLFFHHDDCSEDEDSLLSPVNCQGSPLHGGMLVHGTPLRRGSLGMLRTHGTPHSGSVSPPNMSPICNFGTDMSCQSIKSRYQFAARLDFTTDMSIDASVHDEKELTRLEDAELETSTSLLRSKFISSCSAAKRESREKPCATDKNPHENVTTEMESLETTSPNYTDRQEVNISSSKNNEIVNTRKLSADWCVLHSNESYLSQNNTLLGHSGSGQQSASCSAQDTGYQTSSMSNTTGTIDSCSITPMTQNFPWTEKVVPLGDEIQLSEWQDNMKNMFSSTPSKYARRKNI